MAALYQKTRQDGMLLHRWMCIRCSGVPKDTNLTKSDARVAAALVLLLLLYLTKFHSYSCYCAATRCYVLIALYPSSSLAPPNQRLLAIPAAHHLTARTVCGIGTADVCLAVGAC